MQSVTIKYTKKHLNILQPFCICEYSTFIFYCLLLVITCFCSVEVYLANRDLSVDNTNVLVLLWHYSMDYFCVCRGAITSILDLHTVGHIAEQFF